MKKGEKILYGVAALIVIVAVGNFIVLEQVRANSDKPLFPVRTHYDFSEEGKIGFRLYRQSKCYDCHRAIGSGTSMGLNLDGIGSIRSFDYLYNFLKEPEKTYRAKTVRHGAPPKEASYVATRPDEELRSLAVFMSELKAEQGSSSASIPPNDGSGFIDAMLDIWVPDGWRSQFKDVRKEEQKPNPSER